MSKGMVTAVGGLAVYKVIAAAAPPASAPEGTILAVTERPMPKYSMRRALSDIAAPETGEVCLLLNSDGSFVPLDKREVYAAYILAVYQYDGGKWQSIAWRVRKGGKWITPRLYLWSPGNNHTVLTGNWVGDGSAGGECISVTTSSSGYDGPIYKTTYTAKKVDLTHYSKLIAEVERIAGNGPSWSMYAGAGSKQVVSYAQEYSSASASGYGKKLLEVDVSQAVGEFYVTASIGGGYNQTYDTMAVYNVWLE